jgi:peptidoglycan/xylan/chitin deacetylase (PgdA/CDA1 family)
MRTEKDESESAVEKSRSRQGLLVVGCLAVFGLVATAVPADSDTPARSPVKKAEARQKVQSVAFTISLDTPFRLDRLRRQPGTADDRRSHLCVDLKQASTKSHRRVCLGGRKKSGTVAGLITLSARGKVVRRKTLPVTAERPDSRTVRFRFLSSDAGLESGVVSWKVLTTVGCGGPEGPCISGYPRGRTISLKLRKVTAVSCTTRSLRPVRKGPGSRKLVALTFDDGPSPYTRRILRILDRQKAKGTFFVIGNQVPGNADLTREILAKGHELANHSSTHRLLPSGPDVRRATRTIKRVTGFRPCTFRPPYGARDRRLDRDVKQAGLKTIMWDVDTNDWRTPGKGRIYRSIVGSTRPGSIVLMHDGGGVRTQTAAALEPAIRELRRRGYRFVTTTELLGGKFRYRVR